MWWQNLGFDGVENGGKLLPLRVASSVVAISCNCRSIRCSAAIASLLVWMVIAKSSRPTKSRQLRNS